MEKIISKQLCTGCTSCMNICPNSAITMKTSTDGFNYPVINQNKCINCNLCKKVCPVLNFKKNSSINNCFVGYAKDDKVIEKASSGGVFPLIADYVLSNKGIVIGAKLNNKNRLKHIAITNKDELDKLKGSKYLQSDLENIFTFIKEKIKDNKILFVGTPCQVAGLKSFIKNDFNNLICIDLVCHGVASPKLFDKYIKELEEQAGDKIIDYNFRDKSTGWDTYSNTAIFKYKKKTELYSKNNYMNLFLSDIALRESCYNCNFKLENKYSDITLGDFWGVNKYYPEMYNKKGVSAIIINTDLGKEIFNNIKEHLEYKYCKLEEIVDGNPSLKFSGKYSDKRDDFFRDLDNNTIEYLTNKYQKKCPLYKNILNKTKKIIKKILKY